MGYLGYLIALVKTLIDGGDLPLTRGVDMFLDTAVRVNTHLLYVSIVLWLVGAALIFLPVIFGSGRNIDIRASISGCGCFFAPFIVFLPVVQFIVLRLNVGMANAFGPMGPIEPTKFWILTIITLLLGSG